MAEVEAVQHAGVDEGRMAVAKIIGSVIIDKTPHLEIAVEVPGLTKTVPVDFPARPGAVRAAVEKALRDLGLTRL